MILVHEGLALSFVLSFPFSYAQFICGILFIVGFATRCAAVVMIINFIAALIIAHIGDKYTNMFPALMMLAAACFLFVHGAGKASVDSLLEKREAEKEVA